MFLAVFLAAIYLAKVWVGAFLGRILLKPAGATKRDWLLGLLVGQLVLTIVGFPYLGGLVRLGVVCLGGSVCLAAYRASRPVIITRKRLLRVAKAKHNNSNADYSATAIIYAQG